MIVGYLGPSGSFTHNAALSAFPLAELRPFDTITEVIKAYEKQLIDFAIVPVENSIEGSVHETTDYLFHQTNLSAVAEIIQPIKQQLMTVSTLQPEKIFSHPQAIAQGRKYLTAHYPNAEIEHTSSTAYAARLVADNPDKSYAAIAPVTAATEYGLTIIAKDIQEIDENVTRFWVFGELTDALPLRVKERKLSLALTLPNNQPGALYIALSVFAWRGIDLTKIESRPLKTMLGEYFFMIDVIIDNDVIAYALEELEKLGIHYKILGDYKVHLMGEGNID